jgi:tetratricopeptide (TPR) repeat protein
MFTVLKHTFSLISVFFVIQSIWAQVPEADKKFNQGDYQSAVEIYKKPLKNERKELTQYRYLRMGDCYRLLYNAAKAKQNYALALELDLFPEDIYYLHYGSVLMQMENFLEAKIYLNHYLQKNPDDQLGKAKLSSCELQPYLVTQIAEFRIYPVTRINTPGREYSPVLYADGFIFVSTALKEGINSKFAESVNEDKPAYYFSKKGAEGWKPEEPRLIFESAFSNSTKGPISIDHVNKQIWFSKVVDEKQSKTKKFGQRAEIYSAKLEGMKYSEIKPFSLNNSEYSVMHPAISADGKKLYFVSDMPGGLGKTDIYVSEMTPQGWGKPKNLGEKVNTPGNELYPFVDKKGDLYFSSDGKVGFGGLDIYHAKFSAETIEYCYPLKKPFNSSTDDYGITISEDGRSGYFASSRQGGRGKEDIYYFILNEASDAEDLSEITVSNSYVTNTSDQISNRKKATNTSPTASIEKVPETALAVAEHQDKPKEKPKTLPIIEKEPEKEIAAVAVKSNNFLTPENALESFKTFFINNNSIFIEYIDSLFTQEKIRNNEQQQMKYELDKQEILAKAEWEKNDVLALVEAQKQKVIFWSAGGSLLMALLLALFIFSYLRLSRKQKKIIEAQKSMATEKKPI